MELSKEQHKELLKQLAIISEANFNATKILLDVLLEDARKKVQNDGS